MVLWTLGTPGQEASVVPHADSSTLPHFLNNSSLMPWLAFSPNLGDDLFVISKQGAIAHQLNLGTTPLPGSEATLDGWVRALLQ